MLHTLIGDNVFSYEPGQMVAIRLEHGRIVLALPADADLAAREAELADDGVLDCRGKLLLPGLIDAHEHAIATGMLMLT
jgi:predicted amidohydrolase YtcJ